MFFPVGIDHVIKRLPRVTIAIIALCTAVQVYSTVRVPSEEEVGQEIIEKIRDLPADQITDEKIDQIAADANRPMAERRFGYEVGSGWNLNLLLSTFVHAGWLHLLGNMLFLWLAGAALEDRWGPARFAAFYLAGAIAATFTFAHLHGEQRTTLVGASGAISALMGAFLVCFTRMRIWIAYWVWLSAGVAQIAAYLALPLWFGEQVFEEWMAGSDGGVSSVAFSAHIGGFLFGLGVALGARAYRRERAMAAGDPDPDTPPDALPKAIAQQLPKQLPAELLERFTRCMAAIHKRDQGAVRTSASRVILDLAKAGDRGRILELYDALASNIPSLPITDAAFAAAAKAADDADDAERYVAIAEALSREHPYSTQTPKVLWRLAELHHDAGRDDAATATLQQLAKRFPRDELGKRAAEKLGG